MIICRTVAGLKNELAKAVIEKKSIGFVPTMGALHNGHTALIDRCVKENNISVCSIFVNPTQFNNADDLRNYPRAEKEDCVLLEHHQCNIVFIPEVDEIYADKKLLEIDFGLLETTMEGKYRPGHFKGVATVVNKLFKIVNPQRAYFGEKDFQQLAIIRFMVRHLKISVEIIGCETVRETDGLAMSSRNIHLTPPERNHAPLIYKALQFVKEKYIKENNIDVLKKEANEIIQSTSFFKVEYFEFVNASTLQPIQTRSRDVNVRACAAILTSKTRLIDNIAIQVV